MKFNPKMWALMATSTQITDVLKRSTLHFTVQYYTCFKSHQTLYLLVTLYPANTRNWPNIGLPSAQHWVSYLLLSYHARSLEIGSKIKTKWLAISDFGFFCKNCAVLSCVTLDILFYIIASLPVFMQNLSWLTLVWDLTFCFYFAMFLYYVNITKLLKIVIQSWIQRGAHASHSGSQKQTKKV